MSERSNIRGFSEDLAKTPGPARYGSTENNIYLKKNPQELAQISSHIASAKTAFFRVENVRSHCTTSYKVDFRKSENEQNADR